MTTPTTSTLPTKTLGINSILNKHYNDNKENFKLDIESQNLKTVLLKIGEVSSISGETMQQWYNRQPRIKKQKLHKVPKNLSTKAKFDLIKNYPDLNKYSSYNLSLSNWENFKKLTSTQKGEVLSVLTPATEPVEYSKVPEDVSKVYQDLQNLDGYFHKYFVARKQLLEAIWKKQGGLDTTINSLKISFMALEGYSYKEIEIETKRKRGNNIETIKEKKWVIANQFNQELKPYDLYEYVQKVFQDKITQCDLHPQFLSNLWSDVAAQYHGYINKLLESEYAIKKSIETFKTFVEKVVNELDVQETRNPFNREKNKLKNITPTILKIYSERNKLDIKNFNQTISELLVYIKLWFDNYPDNDNNPIKKVWEEVQQLSSGTKSIRVKFNHERSFPRFRDDKTLDILFGEANSLFPDIYADWYKSRKYRMDRKNPTIRPFNDSYLTPLDLENPKAGLKEIPESELSPNAIAHKYWTVNNSELSVKIQYLYELAIKKEDELLDIFYAQPPGQKNFALLREFAGWIAVRAIAAGLPLKEKERKDLSFNVNLVCSQIQTCFNEFEPDFHQESIYLSGMYRDLTNSCGFLYTNLENQNLSLLVDFENTIQAGNVNVKTLIYTNDQDQEYAFDKDNPLEYINYNKPLWKSQSVDLNTKTLFNLPLHFGLNQSRKYFWNKLRVDAKGQNVHNIFDVASRLKISSMRLIKKHDPIKSVWEYYLSLAIYRLEESQVNLDLEKSKSIVGVDFGENQLAAFTSTDLNGKKISSRNFDESLTKHVLEIHDQIEKQIEVENYASPILRKKLGNKLKSSIQRASSQILKLNLDNNIVVFEQDAKGKDKHISFTKGSKGFQKTTLLKGFRLLQRSASKARAEVDPNIILTNALNITKIKIDKKDLLGIVPTYKTSDICSNCTHHEDHEKQIDQRALKNLFINNSNIDTLNLLDYVPYEKFSITAHSDLFSLDLNKISNDYNKTTFKEEIRNWVAKQSINPNEKMTFIKAMFAKRPTWFEGNVETYRCLNCGHIEYKSCDVQAGLNIARWRAFMKSKDHQTIDGQFIINEFCDWYQKQIKNGWTEQVNKPEMLQTVRSNRA